MPSTVNSIMRKKVEKTVSLSENNSASPKVSETPIYLCAPVNALVEGLYEENIPLSDIKRHGDFGLGTFDDLDGEMVMLNGVIYQITSDGNAHSVDDTLHTPFAVVTFFTPGRTVAFSGPLTYELFLQKLASLFPSPNLFYALKITGEFAYVKARSVTKQHNYRPLDEAAQDQHVFEFKNVRGCLVGFFTPSFMASLNVPGLHLHFLSEDKKRGGHLLECRPRSVTVEIQSIHALQLSLPMTGDYLHQNFLHDAAAALEKAEK